MPILTPEEQLSEAKALLEGESPQGLRCCEALLRRDDAPDPVRGRAWLLLADRHYGAGRHHEAIKAYDGFLQMAGHFSAEQRQHSRFRRAICLGLAERHDESANALRGILLDASGMSPVQIAIVRYHQGSALVCAGRLMEAITVLRACILPGLPRQYAASARYMIANCLADRGLETEAFAEYGQACAAATYLSAPHAFEAHMRLAGMHIKAGNDCAAIVVCEKFIRNSQQLKAERCQIVEMARLLGEARGRAGQHARAAAAYEAAAEGLPPGQADEAGRLRALAAKHGTRALDSCPVGAPARHSRSPVRGQPCRGQGKRS
jgi:tetratricopeptide (TPR) repeat protein